VAKAKTAKSQLSSARKRMASLSGSRSV
jgi:hypothetical protein